MHDREILEAQEGVVCAAGRCVVGVAVAVAWTAPPLHGSMPVQAGASCKAGRSLDGVGPGDGRCSLLGVERQRRQRRRLQIRTVVEHVGAGLWQVGREAVGGHGGVVHLQQLLEVELLEELLLLLLLEELLLLLLVLLVLLLLLLVQVLMLLARQIGGHEVERLAEPLWHKRVHLARCQSVDVLASRRPLSAIFVVFRSAFVSLFFLGSSFFALCLVSCFPPPASFFLPVFLLPSC